jgi:hypothetical protein
VVSELMGEPMGAFDDLPRVRRGPLHSLYATLRRRAPQMSAARPEGGVLAVGYRGRTARVVWDDDLEVFAWDAPEGVATGPGGGPIGPDVEKAAEVVAAALDAPVSPGASG